MNQKQGIIEGEGRVSMLQGVTYHQREHMNAAGKAATKLGIQEV